MTDPISDMLTRIRNASLAKREVVEIPHSKLKEAIAAILQNQGYIEKMEVTGSQPQRTILVSLSYTKGIPQIAAIERVSKPGRRIFAKRTNLPLALGGHGITIVSTSQGLMTDKEARSHNLGGEVLCRVW